MMHFFITYRSVFYPSNPGDAPPPTELNPALSPPPRAGCDTVSIPGCPISSREPFILFRFVFATQVLKAKQSKLNTKYVGVSVGEFVHHYIRTWDDYTFNKVIFLVPLWLHSTKLTTVVHMSDNEKPLYANHFHSVTNQKYSSYQSRCID